jgi:hypothetical protein
VYLDRIRVSAVIAFLSPVSKDLQQLEEDRQNEQFPIMIALLVAAAVAIFHFENM